MFATRIPSTFALLAFLGGAAASFAVPHSDAAPQGSAQGKTQRKAADRPFVLEAGSHELRDVIGQAARYLTRNYVYDEGDFANAPNTSIELQNAISVPREECQGLVSQLAFARGFAMLPLNERRGVYEWIYMGGPRRGELQTRAAEMTPGEAIANRESKAVVMTSVELEHIDAQAAQNSLRPFFVGAGAGMPAVSFGAVGNARALLVQGFADQVAAALRMLKRVDTPHKGHREPGFDEWKASVERRLRKLEKAAADK